MSLRGCLLARYHHSIGLLHPPALVGGTGRNNDSFKQHRVPRWAANGWELAAALGSLLLIPLFWFCIVRPLRRFE
jgi:hypothetical protein